MFNNGMVWFPISQYFITFLNHLNFHIAYLKLVKFSAMTPA